ncbi:MAG: outer membrane beta-barrel family protein, partial [Saprospiraceae bacterium]
DEPNLHRKYKGMHKRIYLTFVSFFSIYLIHAQSNPVSGNISSKVVNEKNLSISGASVMLLSKNDSTLVKMALTNEEGIFEFEGIKQGEYLLTIREIGMETYYSSPISITNQTQQIKAPVIQLHASAVQLNEVVIKSNKPFIERQLDKLVVNVENLISAAGSSIFEVLEQSPGVVIDQNDNISLKGRQGVIVMINGKPSGIAGKDLANYLRGLPSNTVQKIELITNPSARYDAAGNAGIINIVMKKDQRIGTNGTISLNYGQGKYPKTGQGLTLNHRTKKLNLFASYNYSYRQAFSHLTLYREFLEQGILDGVYDQDNYIRFIFGTHTARAGIDYNLSKNTTMGIVTSGLTNRFNSNGNTHTDVLNAKEIMESYNNNSSKSSDRLKNYSANLNIKHVIDSTGKELSMDLDYAQYENKSDQHFSTEYFNPDASVLSPPYLLQGDINGKLSIKSIKVDYVHPLSHQAKIETGFKSSVVTADNDLKYYDQSSGSAVYDPSQSNHFLYHENINALYINVSKELQKVNFQLGFRAEQTNPEGNQITSQQKFDSSYINLFPSMALNYTISKKHEVGISISRRLDRPSYRQLNPFKFFINNTTYSEGNPYLRPQYTYAVELSHTFNQKIITSFSYSQTTQNITEVIFPAAGLEKITIQSNRNLARFDYYGMNLTLPIQIASWWNSVNNMNAYFGHYTGYLANTNLSRGNFNFNINCNNSFVIGKGWSAEFTGVYRAPEVYGFMKVQGYGFASAGIQKSLFANRGSLKLNITDLFYSNNTSARTDFRDYAETFKVNRDTRVANVAFTYRFGNTKVPGAKRRTGGAEEEKQRAGNG